MAVYRRGKIWWYKFNWNGESVRESTKQTNKRVAEQIEPPTRPLLRKVKWDFGTGNQRLRLPSLSSRIFSPMCGRISLKSRQRWRTTKSKSST